MGSSGQLCRHASSAILAQGRRSLKAEKFFVGLSTFVLLLEAILRDARRLTGHSSRPTIPTAMALGGSDSLPIQLQGKWKSQGMVQKYIRDRGGVVVSSVRQIAAGMREAWEKEEVLTQTESQEPADREKEEGSASDGRAEDDEETEDNVYWATSKGMDALKPDKIVVHLTALAVPGDWRATWLPQTLVSRSGRSVHFSVTCVSGA